MTLSTKPLGIGLNPLAHQRPLSGAEARQVRALAACLKPQSQTPGTAPNAHFPRHHPTACKPQPRHCHTSKPSPRDACHPPGSLKPGKDGSVTTPGGYKIEVCGPCEWKITGPDCKTTRVWGDPHVDEGDGGKWDFKRDSTFMLGDGTRINVTTKPAGPNVTVTQGLEIISGNERVQFKDVDKGQKTPGPVTHDGYQHANSFGNKDVFVMGRETDDWSFKGREVTGSNDNGESFKLGNPLPTRGASASAQDFSQQLGQLLRQLAGLFERLGSASAGLEKGHFGSNHLNAPGTEGSWMKRRQEHLHQGFNDISRMVTLSTQLGELFKGLPSLRRPFNV